jgi:hypothetical protein
VKETKFARFFSRKQSVLEGVLMQTFHLVSALLVLAALFTYLNYRFLQLPPTIGLTALTLLVSLVVLGLGWVVPEVERTARAFVGRIDLGQALLHGMLGFLLFAGALHIDLTDLMGPCCYGISRRAASRGASLTTQVG